MNLDVDVERAKNLLSGHTATKKFAAACWDFAQPYIDEKNRVKREEQRVEQENMEYQRKVWEKMYAIRQDLRSISDMPKRRMFYVPQRYLTNFSKFNIRRLRSNGKLYSRVPFYYQLELGSKPDLTFYYWWMTRGRRYVHAGSIDFSWRNQFSLLNKDASTAFLETIDEALAYFTKKIRERTER